MGLISRLLFFSIFFVAYLVFAPPLLAQGAPPAKFTDLEGVFSSAITWVAIIGGFLAFIALIAGGFRYIVARGDPKAVAAAQSTITWAIIGLAFIIIAWLILVFISDFTEVDVTIFKIGI